MEDKFEDKSQRVYQDLGPRIIIRPKYSNARHLFCSDRLTGRGVVDRNGTCVAEKASDLGLSECEWSA